MSKYNYDKKEDSYGLIEEYEKIFNVLKNMKITLLEIGIFKGDSLKFWSDYFTHPKSKIIGIDIILPNTIFPKKVFTYKCNQNDTFKLKAIAEKYGSFTIIIDDGSHQKKETKNCFNVLWDYIESGGYYVIEDWSIGYFPKKKNKKFKDIVNLIINIIKNVLILNIKGIIMALQMAIALFKKEHKGMVNLITNIIENVIKLNIKGINIIMAPRMAIAFFKKE